MVDHWSVSILGRNEIDCHGLRHILQSGGFAIDHCWPDSPEVSFDGWNDAPGHIIIIDNASTSEALERCANIRAAMRHARIVLITDDCDVAMIRDAFAAGIDGVLARQIASEPLVSAIRLVALGEKVMPSRFVEMLTADGGISDHVDLTAQAGSADLSSREIEILGCLAAGDANKTIARRLSLAEATVKAHIKAILRKLKLDNRTQAAIWAIGRGSRDVAHRGSTRQRKIEADGEFSAESHHDEEDIWRS